VVVLQPEEKAAEQFAEEDEQMPSGEPIYSEAA
jgi:hypothetical protein